jgi:hypothetical protein
MRSRFLFAASFFFACAFGTGVASGQERVVLMLSDARRDLFAQSLAVQLTPRGLQVVVTDDPLGDTALGRAASAQAAAARESARAAIWIDETRHGGALLRVVDASSEALRYAPLPATLSTIEPNVFAAIGESVLDDLIGPPESPVVRAELAVNVRVHAPVPEPPPAPPSFRPATFELEEDDELNGLLPEAGIAFRFSPLFAGVAAGGMLDIAYYFGPHVRASIFGVVAGVFDNGNPAGGPGATLAYVGEGWGFRFELGLQGLAIITQPPAECFDFGCSEPDLDVGWGIGGFGGLGWVFGPLLLGFDVHLLLAEVQDSLLPAPLVTGYLEIAL